MKYLIAAIISATVAALSYIGLDQQLASKIKILAPADKEEPYISKKIPPIANLIAVIVLAAIAFLSTLKIMDKVSDPIGIIKLLLALVCLTGAACFDFREHRIPNFYPLVMAGGAVTLLALGVIMHREDAIAQITSSAIAAVGCCVVLVLAAVITKGGIGAGDIKLIGALALMMGIYVTLGALFLAALTCSVFTIGFLLFRKNKNNKAVPFAPFLLIGYIVTLCLNNF